MCVYYIHKQTHLHLPSFCFCWRQRRKNTKTRDNWEQFLGLEEEVRGWLCVFIRREREREREEREKSSKCKQQP